MTINLAAYQRRDGYRPDSGADYYGFDPFPGPLNRPGDECWPGTLAHWTSRHFWAGGTGLVGKMAT